MRRLTTASLCVGLMLLPLFATSQFTEVGNTFGVDHGNAKDGGVAWADFNNDGCLDLIFNTNTNNAANRTRILYSDCATPDPAFTDNTATHAAGLTTNRCERSISCGDYNNDGNIDFCRNTHNRVEVYLNKGPAATPAYSFGDGTQNPNFVLTTVPGGMNVEGFGWMDYDNDGWLDLVLENHNFGIDIYQNPGDGTANFTHVTPDASPLGLTIGGTTGDYMTLGDYDDDGDVDILARKEGERDLWTNSGAGTFTANLSIDVGASNGNKGGVLFCDFDNDGDFDIFWSDNGTNQIYQQTGLNSGTFAATGEPETSSGVNIGNTIDGCDCGDVDNDGDMDLFVGGSNSNNSYLFLNDGGGGFNFTHNDLNIQPGGNVEGCAFGDYDNDGDLDLYINVNNQPNELWRNGLNNNNYLKVHVKRDLGGSVYRDDLGATAVLKDCSNNILGGIRQVSSAKGHGSNAPAVVHFGLPSGTGTVYLLEIRYTTLSGTRSIIDSTLNVTQYPNQTLTMISPAGAGGFDACTSPLPIELLHFDAEEYGSQVKLDWHTATEINNDYFTIERSADGNSWEFVTQVNGAGNSSSTLTYQEFDTNPLPGVSFYRLKQTDFDGTYTYSDLRAVEFGTGQGSQVHVFPNPTEDLVTITGNSWELEEIRIFNTLGQDVTSRLTIQRQDSKSAQINLSDLASGVYLLNTRSSSTRISKR